ncbi:unnamed protein product [Rotaria magnacalcarata]|uniref:F-box domain-containing protein n=1 Tax=Rotaria magnacalcarata TaxID=392030 RepID=A0A820BYY4_9BILA|nr:unnamed protein product [Rotaria magnacalcarata]
MEYSCVQLYDLPDEILIIILKKIGYYGNGFVYPLPNSMLDRLCLHILPEIHQKIQWFDLESRSMKRILLATPYPNLYGISLYNIQTETAIGLFTVQMKYKSFQPMIMQLYLHISLFCSLIYNILIFCPSLLGHQRLSFDTTPLTIISTNLLKLHVYLDAFTDCLYLLDGRFNQLHTFYANISVIHSSNLSINNKEKLPILKCFSLHCDIAICVHDELI